MKRRAPNQDKDLLSAYKNIAFSNTKIFNRTGTQNFFGLGSREGSQSDRPVELHQLY